MIAGNGGDSPAGQVTDGALVTMRFDAVQGTVDSVIRHREMRRDREPRTGIDLAEKVSESPLWSMRTVLDVRQILDATVPLRAAARPAKLEVLHVPEFCHRMLQGTATAPSPRRFLKDGGRRIWQGGDRTSSCAVPPELRLDNELGLGW